ncbi:beta-1,6-N-acetylglucosaminyltransferase [Paraburkholderia sp. BCC1886]|uniref:beta-1,6-N-acetylglucosaminyltransferase n=1 Tax=Paraburkholderia sp. BCC1886 TaxID=2562670 RepID=UPI0011826907|nr:beta-1,6-N-acetylglucosaminyltransferase [Paraburkholderia sp. BCC1886]
MKINYLISAFANAQHLDRLIQALRTTEAEISFIIHYDKKSASPARDFGRDVSFIDSIPVWWGGWSHQQAIINLAERSIALGADRHVLLSGSDYPIKSNARIISELEGGREIITLRKGFFKDKPANRLTRLHFDGFDRRNKSIKSRIMIMTELMIGLAYRRKLPISDVFHGTTWWALTDECLRHVIDEIRINRKLIDFYKGGWCVEESLFHTIIGHSKFAKHVRNSWLFQDWTTDPAPGPFSNRHIQTLLDDDNQELFFARKFSDGSREIVDRIEVSLRGNLAEG